MRGTLSTLAVLGLAITISGLTGCAAETDSPPDTSTPTAAPTALPTEEPNEESVDDVLFTITANVRAADGRTIGISMTAHAPVESVDPDAAELRDQLIDVCGAGSGTQPITEQYLRENGSTLVKVSIASTAADLTFETPIDIIFGSPYYAQAAVGQGISPASNGVPCFNGFSWAKSGTVLGIGDFENPDAAPDLGQWTTGRYGFFVSPSSGATIEACRVAITDLAMKSNITSVPGWDPSSAGDGISCKIGYAGE